MVDCRWLRKQPLTCREGAGAVHVVRSSQAPGDDPEKRLCTLWEAKDVTVLDGKWDLYHLVDVAAS